MPELGGGDSEAVVVLAGVGGPSRSFAGVRTGDLGGGTFGASRDCADNFWYPSLSLTDGSLEPRRDFIPERAC